MSGLCRSLGGGTLKVRTSSVMAMAKTPSLNASSRVVSVRLSILLPTRISSPLSAAVDGVLVLLIWRGSLILPLTCHQSSSGLYSLAVSRRWVTCREETSPEQTGSAPPIGHRGSMGKRGADHSPRFSEKPKRCDLC